MISLNIWISISNEIPTLTVQISVKPDPYSALDKPQKHTLRGRTSGRSFTLSAPPPPPPPPPGNPFNKKTRELIKNRRRLLNTMKKNKSNNTLKKQLKDLNKEIKKGKKEELNKNWEYIKNKINDRRTTKKSWQTIKKIMKEGNIKKTQEYLKDDNDNKIYNKQDIANSFMNNQKKIFVPNKSNNDREHYLREHWHKNKTFNKRTKNGPYDLIFGLNGEKSLYESDNKITPKEIMTALSKLKNDKAPGIYGIKNKLLLTIKEELAPALVELFNDCLNMSYFPDGLKVAKIIMIPKTPRTNISMGRKQQQN